MKLNVNYDAGRLAAAVVAVGLVAGVSLLFPAATMVTGILRGTAECLLLGFVLWRLLDARERHQIAGGLKAKLGMR